MWLLSFVGACESQGFLLRDVVSDGNTPRRTPSADEAVCLLVSLEKDEGS